MVLEKHHMSDFDDAMEVGDTSKAVNGELLHEFNMCSSV